MCVELYIELCKVGFPVELELVYKAFPGSEEVERLVDAGLVAVGGGFTSPLACRETGNSAFPPAPLGYVVVPWLKKALGPSPLLWWPMRGSGAPQP